VSVRGHRNLLTRFKTQQHKETPVEGIGARIGLQGPGKAMRFPCPDATSEEVPRSPEVQDEVSGDQNWPEYDRALARRGSRTPCWDFDGQEIARGHSWGAATNSPHALREFPCEREPSTAGFIGSDAACWSAL